MEDAYSRNLEIPKFILDATIFSERALNFLSTGLGPMSVHKELMPEQLEDRSLMLEPAWAEKQKT